MYLRTCPLLWPCPNLVIHKMTIRPHWLGCQTDSIENYIVSHMIIYWGFPGGSDGKVSACNEGDPGSIPGPGRSPREGNGNPLQNSCLENPMDRGSIFLDQGLNLRPLQWQADSHALCHGGSPLLTF